MIKTKRLKQVAMMGAAAAAAAPFSPTLVAAQEAWNANSQGLVCVAGVGNDVATIQGIGCLVANAMSVVFAILGAGGLIMITTAGLRYMLSGGSAKGVETAKNSIKGVIIGLILMLASLLILTIIKQVIGVDVTKVIFPTD